MSNYDWYALDNAAQLFPVISSEHDTNAFRLAAVIKEDVDKDILLDALKKALERFPTFCVKLKKGFFWYYLEHNDNEPTVREENPFYCESNNYNIQNGFLFNVTYYGKRIAIEIFHGITDGTGGNEFFKAILYHYFLLKGYKIDNSNGEILTSKIEQLLDESQDSFKYNYRKKIKAINQESKGYTIKGVKHSKRWNGCIQVIIDVDSLKKVTQKYEATITQYIGALLIYSIYENYIKGNDDTDPICLFIPVNARKYFDSKTLRNFVLFIRVIAKYEGDVTFQEILDHVKATFNEELNKDKLLSRIKANVHLETNFPTRISPLFLKRLIIKIGYHILGSRVNTMSFSNLGVVKLPKDMYQYIDRMEFGLGVSKNVEINTSAITVNNRMVLTFVSMIIERKIQTQVIQTLIKEGVDLVVETNDLEV